jgi:uncharacterized protein (TIGR03032 family)
MARPTQGRLSPTPPGAEVAALWVRHHAAWRDPAQVVSQWSGADAIDPRLLAFTVRGAFWDALASTGATLLVTREYEHLVMALRVGEAGREVSYLPLPHPSGLAADRRRGLVHVASTRNPNQVFDLAPARGGKPLVPVRARFLPGCLYLHDLALIGGGLYGNAVGHNAVVRLHEDGRFERVWWPRCIENSRGPLFDRNHLQLNSIAAGADLAGSFFSASGDRVTARRPGHVNYPVDRRGVIFSGATREVVVRGLTRPHSARLRRGRVWVANSGYGEVGVADGTFAAVARLPGWTRGLCFCGPVLFAGTSRVIPRYRHYAPGLDADDCVCGLHALDATSGRVLGSLLWPYGHQIFAIDWLPATTTAGLPFRAGGRRAAARALFYDFAACGLAGAAKPQAAKRSLSGNNT